MNANPSDREDQEQDYPATHADLAELLATITDRIKELETVIRENPESPQSVLAEIEKQALENAKENIQMGKQTAESAVRGDSNV